MLPAVKMGPVSPASERPGLRGTGEEVAERRAGRAERGRQVELRVVERLRGADVGIGGDEVLLGLQDVRPSFEQRRRQPGGNRGARELVDRLAARDGIGVAALEHGDQVLLRGDLLLELRDRGQRLLVLRLDLRDLELRHHAALVPQVEDPDGVLVVGGRLLRDLELPVERAQRDVARRHARDHGQHDAAPSLLGRVHLRLRGFGLPANASEEVGLPLRAKRPVVEVVVRAGVRGQRRHADGAGARAGRVAVVVRLRIELRPRRLQSADERVDARRGDHEVAVLLQRRFDEPGEHRVVELLPPARVRDVGGLRVVDAPGGGRIDRGLHVVRADRAAAGSKRRGEERQADARAHVSVPSRRWPARRARARAVRAQRPPPSRARSAGSRTRAARRRTARRARRSASTR